jgi:DNA processing protein
MTFMRVGVDPSEDFELALCFAPKVGSETFRNVLAKKATLGLSSEDCFGLDRERLIDSLQMPSESAAAFADSGSPMYGAIAKYKENIGTKPVRLVTTASAIYPQRVVDYCKSPPAFLFLYGNVRVLSAKTFAVVCSRNPSPGDLDSVERAAVAGVLSSMALVGGTNTDAYQRASIVPLRWGAPRILVLDRGLFCALGDDLEEEPFRAARLWRYRFDPEADLVISRNRPFDEYAASNQSYRDELVVALADQIDAIRLRPNGNMDKLSKRAEELGRSVTRV